MKNLKLTFFIFFLVISSLSAQQTLHQKYKDMMERTETYEQYKVIPQTTLDAFWAEVVDSLNQQSTSIGHLKSQVTSRQNEINALQAKLGDIQTKLDESLRQEDSINFLGMTFSKIGYHIMVWIIIAVLGVAGGMSYLLFIRSNNVTSKIRREYEELQDEFETYRNVAREKQAKLKRELQTAINQLNERR